MLNDETGQYRGLRGSNVKGKDLVRLSVGITAIVFVFIPFAMLSLIALVLILSTSIEFAIFGSFVPYSVFVTSFRGGSRGRVQGMTPPLPPPEMACGFLIQLYSEKKNYVV